MDKDEQPRAEDNTEQQTDNRPYDPQEVESPTDSNSQMGTYTPVTPQPLSPLPPASFSTPVDTPQMPSMPQKKARRKWLIPAIVAGILVVLGGSSALAYKFWYQNPQKVMSDSLMHAIEAKSLSYKATSKVESPSGTFTITLNGASKDGANSIDASVLVDAEGKTYTIKGSAVIDKKSDIYIKVANVDALLADFQAQLPSSLNSVLTTFIAKINDQWIKISNDKIKSFSDEYAKLQKCTQSAVEKIRADKSYSSEIVDLYKAHSFLSISKELGSKDGSLGYEVKSDTKAGKAFGEGFKKTKTFKMLHDCDDSFSVDTSNESGTADTPKVQVWVSRWTHEITKVTTNGKSGEGTMSAVFEPVFNKDVTVKTPEKSKSVDELMGDIQELESAWLQASMEASMQAQSLKTTGLFST
jgi:hypothetical protein